MKSGRMLIALLSGFLASYLLYPLTHGRHKKESRIPELAGIAAGCMLVDAAIWFLWGDDETVLKAFVAEALVGLGVAGNRMRMTLRDVQ